MEAGALLGAFRAIALNDATEVGLGVGSGSHAGGWALLVNPEDSPGKARVMRIRRCLALVVVCVMWAGVARSGSLSPYAAFVGLNESELNTVQVKLTKVGHRWQPEYVLAFTSAQHPLDLSVFRPFYRPDFLGGYSLDSSTPRSFTASAQELAAVIESVAAVPSIVDGGVDINPGLSFAISVVRSDTVRVFESLLDTTDTRLLFGRLLGALGGNAEGAREVTLYACHRGLLPGPTISDVSSLVSVVVRGPRKDRAAGRYIARARITNTSSRTIQPPVILAFYPGMDIALVSSSGMTCAVWPHGAPYTEIPVGAGLTPGGHADVVLLFENPDDLEINVSAYRVYAGPGFR